ncbi:hypothetical protein CDIK_2725 [Cucumispora dikerogammari]|nr:hypothetical protein CDIK_2725 [Cucumispora dikerogammari]
MVKIQKLFAQKVRYAVNKYLNNFFARSDTILFCRLCEKKVNYDKFSLVEQHRKGELHVRALSQLRSGAAVQSRLNFTNVTKSENIIMGFLSANIALYKLRNKTLVKVFTDLGVQLPFESTVRRSVKKFVDNYVHDIKNNLKKHEVF